MSSASIRLIAFLYLIVLSTQYIGIDNFWFARDLIAKGQWWRLVSAHFIHANSVHCTDQPVMSTLLLPRLNSSMKSWV